MVTTSTTDKLLRIEDLKLHFNITQGVVQAVDGVEFELDNNSSVVILGESGCGKSSLAKAILRLLPRNAGTYTGKVWFGGQDVMQLDDEAFRRNVRWVGMSMVPQAALNSLNPVVRIGEQVAEPVMVHHGLKKDEAWGMARRMFQHVGVPEDFLIRYPFELSGGMRQRSALAMALVTLPNLIILDEPTRGIDVGAKHEVYQLISELAAGGTGVLIISSEIEELMGMCDRIIVMGHGEVLGSFERGEFDSETILRTAFREEAA